MVPDDALQDYLPSGERQWPEIAAALHEAIEGVEDRLAWEAQQLVELRPAGRVQHNDFAIEDGVAVQRAKGFWKRSETLARTGNKLNIAAGT